MEKINDNEFQEDNQGYYKIKRLKCLEKVKRYKIVILNDLFHINFSKSEHISNIKNIIFNTI